MLPYDPCQRLPMYELSHYVPHPDEPELSCRHNFQQSSPMLTVLFAFLQQQSPALSFFLRVSVSAVKVQLRPRWPASSFRYLFERR
jgi:hypothetical protein